MANKRAKPGSAAELAELYPAPKVIAVRVRSAPDAETFGDATVTVDEMDIIQIAQAADALANVSNLTSDNLLLIATQHREEVLAAVGIAIRWPAERVGLLSAGSFGRLLTAVYEMNNGFFTRLLSLLAFEPRGMAAAPPNGAGELPLPIFADTAESKSQDASH